MHTLQEDPASVGDLEAFIGFIVGHVVAGLPPAQILDRAAQAGPVLMPELAKQALDGDAGPMFRLLSREIIDRTPRPELRFAVRKVELPGRNDPCLCGSGRKYKQCCGPLEHANPGLGELDLLPYVLDHLPRKRWHELAGSAVNPDQVAHTAHELQQNGRLAEAAVLLEPWFKGEHPIPARHEWLFDTLLDVYTDDGKPRKKKQLLQAGLARGDRTIRSAALQRLATMSSDAGDYEQAWRYFRDAQREDADSPALSHLEVTLLLAQGQPERARERARFWIARLTRQDAEGYRGLIDLLRQVAEQGEQAMFAITQQEWPELEVLRDLLTQAPAPAVQHRLQVDGDESAGPITPKPKLHKALAYWRSSFPDVGPGLTAMRVPDHQAWEDAEPWLECLRQHPILWQSFDVLDDLVLALQEVPALAVRDTLIEPILGRAEQLFDLLIAASEANGKRVEWGWHENRPALRLLAQRIVTDLEQPGDATIARMERLLALNPNDNHGFRGELMAAYLHCHQFQQAEKLAQQFDEDTELTFSRALAQWAMGRHGEALRYLQQAHSVLPRLLPMLLAAKPRKPKLNPAFVSWNGDDQAWLFRERSLPLWQAVPGALEWLREAARALK